MQGEPKEEDIPAGTRSCGYSEKVGYISKPPPPSTPQPNSRFIFNPQRTLYQT